VGIIDKQIIKNHKELFDTMNVIVARNKIGYLIVVSSKRSTKPNVPFIISSAVFQQWKARDSKAIIVDLPYEELIKVIPLYFIDNQNEPLVIVKDFSEIEFTEV
jgi:sulfur relay (sulfurtransferase) DsrF/TusC family protein